MTLGVYVATVPDSREEMVVLDTLGVFSDREGLGVKGVDVLLLLFWKD